MITTERLDCGLRLVTEAMSEARSVAIGFWVGIGSRDESDAMAGASHFLEHLLFKGSATRSARAIAESIDAVGGEMNAFTTKEYTAFYVRLLSDDLDLGIDILSDVVWSPALRPEDVAAERQVILEEIRMHADEPSDHVHEVFQSALFPGHPLGRQVLGLAGSVEAMTAEDVRAFFGRHYRPENMVVAMAGDLEHGRVRDGIESRFAGAPGGEAPVRTPPAGPPDRAALVARQTEQAHLVAGTRAIGRHDRRRWDLEVMNHALGGGMSSRLFQEIRERRGLAYSVFSERASYHDSGALSVYVGTAPEQIDEVVGLVDSELDDLAVRGVSEGELNVARGHIRAEVLLSLEDSSARMGRLGRSLLLHDEVLEVDELLSRVAAVTVDSVGQVASEVLAGQRSVAIVGPLDHMTVPVTG